MNVLVWLLMLLASGLSLAVTGLLLALANVFRQSPSTSDNTISAGLAAAALLWTAAPAALALWSYETRHEVVLLGLLLLWGAASVGLVWMALRGIEAAARP